MLATPAVEAEFELKWRMGARTAALICHLARRFESSIELEFSENRANAKDILGIMLLDTLRPKLPDGSYNFGPEAGSRLRLIVTGSDARQAAEALKELFTLGDRTIHCRNSDCISSPILVDYDHARIYYSCSNLHVWEVSRASGLREIPKFKFR